MQKYSITIPTPPGTVFGGEIDVGEGEIKSKFGKIVIDGTNNKVSSNGTSSSLVFAKITVSDKKAGTDNFYSDKFSVKSSIGGIAYRATGRAASGLIEFSLPIDVGTTANELNTWFSNNNTEVVYELAEHVTYSITPQDIETLSGVNHVWAEDGEISVKYWGF